MSKDLGILELLKSKSSGAVTLAALAAKTPAHEPPDAAASPDAKLNEVLNRIIQLTGSDVRRGEPAKNVPPESVARTVAEATSNAALGSPITNSAAAGGGLQLNGEFIPMEPSTIHDAGLTDSEVEALILKYL